MGLKLVVFVAALLALTQGVLTLPTGLKDRLMQKPFATCNPHLILPNGARMEVDVVSYYYKVDSMCLGGLVMSIFKVQKGAGLFEQGEDTAICHGFVKLLSLIDAYHWTEEMCTMRVIEDERRPFCDRYIDNQKNIEVLVERYKAIGYDDLTTIIETLSAFKEEGKCKDFCGGPTDSALCGGFVDASRFFLSKMESDTPEKIIITELPDSTESESLYTLTSSDKPSDSQSSEEEADNSEDLATPPPSDGETVASSDTPTSEAPTEPSSESVPIGEGDGQQDGEPADDTDTNEPIGTELQENTDFVGGGLARVVEELGTTKQDIRDMLGPEFQDDLDRMSYEEILNALNEKVDDLDDEIIESIDEMPELVDLDDLEEIDWKEELSEETGFEGVLDDIPTASFGELQVVKDYAFDDWRNEDVDHEGKKSYAWWHFFTVIVVLAVLAVGGYLCVHNREKIRERVGSYMSDALQRRKQRREYQPLFGQS